MCGEGGKENERMGRKEIEGKRRRNVRWEEGKE